MEFRKETVDGIENNNFKVRYFMEKGKPFTVAVIGAGGHLLPLNILEKEKTGIIICGCDPIVKTPSISIFKLEGEVMEQIKLALLPRYSFQRLPRKLKKKLKKRGVL